MPTVRCGWYRCGKSFHRSPRKVRHDNFCSLECHAKFKHSMGRLRSGAQPRAWCGPNKLERDVHSLLSEVGIPVRFVGDDPTFFAGGLSVDFVNEVLGLVVEVFGNNFHTDADVLVREQALRSGGWELLVIWESELRGKNWSRIDKRAVKKLCRRLTRWWRTFRCRPFQEERPPLFARQVEEEVLAGDLAHGEEAVPHEPDPAVPF